MQSFITIKEVTTTLKIHGAVLSYLADANGEPVSESNKSNAHFIKTQMFLTEFSDYNEAYAAYDDLLQEYPNALFISLQNDNGESII